MDPSLSFWYYSFPLNRIQQILSFSSRKDAATVICRCLGSTIPYHEICLKITIYNWQMINQLSRAMFNSYVINDQRVSHKKSPNAARLSFLVKILQKTTGPNLVRSATTIALVSPTKKVEMHQQCEEHSVQIATTKHEYFEPRTLSGLNIFEPITHNLLVFWTKKHSCFSSVTTHLFGTTNLDDVSV